MPQFDEIIKESFTIGPIAWISWCVPVACTLTTKAWHELPVLSGIYQFLGFIGLIELCIIILLLRIIYVTYRLYVSVLSTHNLKADPETLMTHLNTCLAELNEAKAAVSIEDKSKNLQKFCNKTKSLFDKLTCSPCCVSIKVVMDERPSSSSKDLINKQVINLFADDLHKDRHSDEYNEIEHIISENTAFINVINTIYKKRNFYIGKNLRKDENYLTSSAKCSLTEGKTYNKELPYDSELVLPIFKKLSTGNNQLCFRGFLCIDSQSSEGFNSDGIEVFFARILSDGLYDLIPQMKTQNP